jgi:hypothetical protein
MRESTAGHVVHGDYTSVGEPLGSTLCATCTPDIVVRFQHRVSIESAVCPLHEKGTVITAYSGLRRSP